LNARRGWALPLVPLYRAGLAVVERFRGKPKVLGWPVVSVGSLSAGGAGKTPVVIALARLLTEAGWGVDVLSRGYGRDGAGVERVVASEGAAERFGDEPVLIAERAGVEVWVGADRFAAGSAAEAAFVAGRGELVSGAKSTAGLSATAQKRAFGRDDRVEVGRDGRIFDGEVGRLHLLDDGFQHRRLGRAVDVVLVTAEDLEDVLIPAGNLREPPEALGRADVVVVREDEVDEVAKRVWPLMREGAQMWVVRRRLQFPAPLFVFGAGLRPVAFCGLARPEGFAAMLMEAGCGLVETVAFQDHHRYTMADIERVIEVAKGLNATGFVTTEKDAVKLTAAMRERLEAVGRFMVVGLEAEFDDGAAVVRAIELRLLAATERAA
jgi:tetraacyldisaccharide 4'-kinase